MNNTRKKITEAAIHLFKEKGYENTSVTDICKEANITKGTFYYHFPNKDEITFEFYDLIHEDFYDEMIKIMMIPNARDQLWKVYEFAIDRTIELTPQVLYAIIMSDIQKGFDFFTPYQNTSLNTNSSKNTRLQIEIVKKGQAVGEIKEGNAEMMVRTFISALLGIAIAWGRSNGAFDEKEELKKAFEIIF